MEEKLDVLGRETIINKLICLVKIISKNNQGCCFGLDGFWGSGKSFVLDKFEKEIKLLQSEESCSDKYYVFHYDCWKYDYYDEPAIAIIAAMLDDVDKELNILNSDQRNLVKKAAWETIKGTLKNVAGELCKNKIGIDLVEIATNVIDDCCRENDNCFDSFYGFKRALEETRNGIQKIANTRTVIIVVDELDRCLPAYTIKVLERLHHVFTDLKNVIVIISMDKIQIEHSIKEIYGEIDVDIYLRKFISFKVNLDNGKAGQYLRKYAGYTSMFDISHEEETEIENFFVSLLEGIDIRTQERIFYKAETIHRLINDNEIRDSSIMTFEILYLTISIKTKSKDLSWLIDRSQNSRMEKMLGKNCYDVLRRYEANACNEEQKISDQMCIKDNLTGKTIFWVANLYSNYKNGVCEPYFYSKHAEKRVSIIKKFSEFIDCIDCD